MSNVLDITSDVFTAEVLGSESPVLIDFYSIGCAPCRVIAPIVDAIAEEFANRAKVYKVNVYENLDIAQQYGIMSMPTLVFFKDGKVMNMLVGARYSQEFIAEELSKYL